MNGIVYESGIVCLGEFMSVSVYAFTGLIVFSNNMDVCLLV